MIKKLRPEIGGAIRKPPLPDPELRFSFKLFDHTDEEMCPRTFSDGYTQALMRRLRDLSSWTVRQFTTRPDKSVRNHSHEWSKTDRPEGFGALNEHYQAYSGWQFCITANEHGRVHGIIIDDTFYVIWLDRDHRLYP
ncbi:MAG TPA: hypothetical protein VIL72_07150 [Beijerinckiaceae bacterium]|jgi:hypothetical protein